MKKPEVNFLPVRILALDNKMGEDEMAAKTMAAPAPLLINAISLSSNKAGSGLIVPGRITQS